jgi:hypothetical protein
MVPLKKGLQEKERNLPSQGTLLKGTSGKGFYAFLELY